MKLIIQKLYRQPIFSRLFHTLVYCLQKELRDCKTVLDIGCGYSSPLQYCLNVKQSVGVEPFRPYLLKSKKKKIHSRYINKKIEDLDFKKKNFDAVILIDVLEHLPEKTSLKILKKAEQWAKKKIIVTSPNGFLPQGEADNNPWQKHLSGWDWQKMKKLGFRSRGLAGLKWLRKENENETMGDDFRSSIRFYPKSLWFSIATLSQLITYWWPSLAFELFSVKEVSRQYDADYYQKIEYGFASEIRSDHQRLLELIPFRKSSRVLEIGCGFGVFLEKVPVSQKFGIEISRHAASVCQKKGLKVSFGDAEKKFRFPDKKFDVIVMNELIEHLKKPEKVIEECYRLLKDRGILAITTPNRSVFLKAYHEPTHFSEMNIRELRALLEENGFQVLNHEVNGLAPLFPLLEWFVFRPGRLVKKILAQQKKSLVDKIHSAADKSVLSPLAAFRKWGLRWGLQQLIIAQKGKV